MANVGKDWLLFLEGCMTRLFSSLRFRLTLLVLFAILPAGAVVLHSGLEQRRLVASQAKGAVLRLVRIISNNNIQLIEGTEHFLFVLANFPRSATANPLPVPLCLPTS